MPVFSNLCVFLLLQVPVKAQTSTSGSFLSFGDFIPSILSQSASTTHLAVTTVVTKATSTTITTAQRSVTTAEPATAIRTTSSTFSGGIPFGVRSSTVVSTTNLPTTVSYPSYSSHTPSSKSSISLASTDYSIPPSLGKPTTKTSTLSTVDTLPPKIDWDAVKGISAPATSDIDTTTKANIHISDDLKSDTYTLAVEDQGPVTTSVKDEVITKTTTGIESPWGRSSFFSSSFDETLFQTEPPFSAEEHLRQLRIRAGLEPKYPLDLKPEPTTPRSSSTSFTVSTREQESSHSLSIPSSTAPSIPPKSAKPTETLGLGWFDNVVSSAKSTVLLPPQSGIEQTRSASISTPSIPNLFGSFKVGFGSATGTSQTRTATAPGSHAPRSLGMPKIGFTTKAPSGSLFTNFLSNAASKAQTVAAGAIKQANAAAGAAKEAATHAAEQIAAAQALHRSEVSTTPHSATQGPPSVLPGDTHQPIAHLSSIHSTSMDHGGGDQSTFSSDDHLSFAPDGRPVPVGQEEPVEPYADTAATTVASITTTSGPDRVVITTARTPSPSVASQQHSSVTNGTVVQERRWLHEQTMDVTTDDDYDEDAYDRHPISDHSDEYESAGPLEREDHIPSGERRWSREDEQDEHRESALRRSMSLRKSSAELLHMGEQEFDEEGLDEETRNALHARDKVLMAAVTGIYSPSHLGPSQPGYFDGIDKETHDAVTRIASKRAIPEILIVRHFAIIVLLSTPLHAFTQLNKVVCSFDLFHYGSTSFA